MQDLDTSRVYAKYWVFRRVGQRLEYYAGPFTSFREAETAFRHLPSPEYQNYAVTREMLNRESIYLDGQAGYELQQQFQRWYETGKWPWL
jgi:hypothetical protein